MIDSHRRVEEKRAAFLHTDLKPRSASDRGAKDIVDNERIHV